MAGKKTSHLPTLSSRAIHRLRAEMAFRLSAVNGLSIRNVRWVLRCRKLWEARVLVGDGRKNAGSRSPLTDDQAAEVLELVPTEALVKEYRVRMCYFCGCRPKRGGDRPGSALCHVCFEHDGI